jgi:hypothetical protein
MRISDDPEEDVLSIIMSENPDSPILQTFFTLSQNFALFECAAAAFLPAIRRSCFYNNQIDFAEVLISVNKRDWCRRTARIRQNRKDGP